MVIMKPTLTRDDIVKSILLHLDAVERRGWWGEVGIALVIQNGKVKVIKKEWEKQTEKGEK